MVFGGPLVAIPLRPWSSSLSHRISEGHPDVLPLQRARSADYQKEITAGKGFNSCDSYAMAAAIDDTIITEREEVSEGLLPLNLDKSSQLKSFSHNGLLMFLLQVAVTVELAGTHTRGMMVMDYMEKLKKKHKVTIMKTIDLEKFKILLMNALK